MALILAKLNVAGFYFVVRASVASSRFKGIMKRIDFDSVLPNDGYILEVDGYSVPSGHNRPFVEVPVRLIFVSKGGEIVPLVTNPPPTYTARFVVEVYKARFRIENSYCDTGQMLIRT